MQPLKVSAHVRQPAIMPFSSSPAYSNWGDELLLTWKFGNSGPVCKKMNDISPNAIFLSIAFEPSPEELRAFIRSEKERSRPARDKKPLLLAPSTSKPKVAQRQRPPPAEIVDLSSDEEMPDFSQILARSNVKKEVSLSFFRASWQGSQ